MGGRRAGSLLRLVGSGGAVSAAKGELAKAIGAEDPGRIAEASASLIAKSETGLDALRQSLHLAPFLADNATRLEGLDRKARDEAIRTAWSEIKRREGIDTPQEVDSLVISAATGAFSGGSE